MKYKRLTPRLDKPVWLPPDLTHFDWAENLSTVPMRLDVVEKTITFEQALNRLIDLENRLEDKSLLEVEPPKIDYDHRYEVWWTELERKVKFFDNKPEAEAQLRELNDKNEK